MLSIISLVLGVELCIPSVMLSCMFYYLVLSCVSLVLGVELCVSSALCCVLLVLGAELCVSSVRCLVVCYSCQLLGITKAGC